jgi:4,5-DOPA dioxygenase extradiol
LTQETIKQTLVELDQDGWGLDHGTWSVLTRMFPHADIPVVQLSLDANQGSEFHYALGRELRSLRDKGVLIVGSGNLVHNLGLAFFEDKAYDWAIEFDQTAARLMQAGDHSSLVNYRKLGQAAQLAIPTNEHYLPLLYILALQDKDEPIHFFADKVTAGSLSMRSVLIG